MAGCIVELLRCLDRALGLDVVTEAAARAGAVRLR